MYQWNFSLSLIQLSQDDSLNILRVFRLKFRKNIIFLPPKIDFVLANNADPDEMQHYALCCISSGPALFAKLKVPISEGDLKKPADLNLHCLQ